MTERVGERAKGRWTDWLVVALLMSAMIFSFIDRFALSLLVNPIKDDLGVSDAQLGLLHGVAFGLFYAGMGLPLGWLADRWSRKGTIMVGVGVWSAATAACGLAGNYTQLLLARILVGAGEAGLAPASYGIVHDRFPKRSLGRAMSIFQLGSMVGAGVAMYLAGKVYGFFSASGDAGWHWILDLAPWQKTFIVLALPGLLFVPLIAMIREVRPEANVFDGAAGNLSLVTALREKPMLYASLFLGMSGVIASSYALLAWMPAILGREYGMSPEVVGTTYGLVVLIASPAGLLAGGWAADYLQTCGSPSPHARIAIFTAAVALPLTLVVGLVSTATGLLAIVAALHLVLALPIGVIPALIQTISPAAVRGQLSALYVLVVNLIGLGLSPTLVGALSSASAGDAVGLRHALVLVSVVLLLLGLPLIVKVERLLRQ